MKKKILTLVLGMLTAATPAFAQSYTVQSGDTLWQISQKTNTTFSKILELNSLTNPNLIYPGQKIALTSKADDIIATGNKYLGVKYKWGGDYDLDGSMGFDCSGFIHYIFLKNGIELGARTSNSMSKLGTTVSYDDLQKGDLLFFYSPVHHIAIYAGNGKILQTYGDGGVRYDNLDGWWKSHLTKIKRVL